MNLKQKIFRKNDTPFRIEHDQTLAYRILADQIINLLPNEVTEIIVVCIGTDRSTGDSLGPLTGSLLSQKMPKQLKVYGTLEDPVHAVNLEEKITKIEIEHPNAFLIGIDACLGRHNSVGVLSLGEGPIKPGAGVNKQLPPVGDIHISAIVNVSGFMEFFVLQNTRLHLVMNMATIIARGLYSVDQKLRLKHVPKMNINKSV